MIAIVNYGMGNLGSIKNMLDRIHVESIITSDPAAIEGADKLILPGVGAFDNGMSKLKELGLQEVLNKRVLHDKTPILGVCLGMQLFTRRSEEGSLPGLDWIDADTVRFDFSRERTVQRVPHMGWNSVELSGGPAALFRNMEGTPKFYFVHSYHVMLRDSGIQSTRTTYGYEFTSSIQSGNLYGVQFHPEKSHRYGMQVYINFANL